MKISEIIDIIEQFAPIYSQESWDNSGLQVGDPNKQCSSVYITLDVTPDAVAAAKKCNANLIISHHPILFDPIKSITSASYVGSILLDAIANSIAIYSSHTPFDVAEGGINDYIADKLNLHNVRPLTSSGMGRVGQLEQPVGFDKFIDRLKDLFEVKTVAVSSKNTPIISTVALCGGSGGSLIENGIAENADIFVTGDVKYHNFIQYQNVITIADIGHFGSEKQFIKQVDALISKKIPTFASHIELSNPITFR